MNTISSKRFVMMAVLLALSISAERIAHAESAVRPPLAAFDAEKAPGELQTAVLAGGCFWGVEAVFEHVNGVRKVVSGYSGGDKRTANYKMVGSGSTSHAESVQVTFDPGVISYGEILRIFFSVAHDPTQLNRQGPDTGTQYRSAIFYADDMQKDIATRYISQLNQARIYRRIIVTHVTRLQGFYPAESYHQDFIANNPDNLYVVINDLPKIRNLKQMFPELYRRDAKAR